MSKAFLTTKILEHRKIIFPNKGLSFNNIMHVENHKIVREEDIMANIMNIYFTNITIHLKLKTTKIDPKANLESIYKISSKIKKVSKLANFHFR